MGFQATDTSPQKNLLSVLAEEHEGTWYGQFSLAIPAGSLLPTPSLSPSERQAWLSNSKTTGVLSMLF